MTELLLIKILVLISFAFLAYKITYRIIKYVTNIKEHPKLDAAVVSGILSLLFYDLFLRFI